MWEDVSRFADLSSLGESLGAILGASQGKAKKGLGLGGAKQRRKIQARETRRMGAVLAHPRFQADPLASIANHLSATLPQPEVAPRPRKASVSGSMKKKLKKMRAMASKGLAAAEDRDDAYMADISSSFGDD